MGSIEDANTESRDSIDSPVAVPESWSQSRQQSSQHATVHRSPGNNLPSCRSPPIQTSNNPSVMPEIAHCCSHSRRSGRRHTDPLTPNNHRAAILSRYIQTTLLPSCHHPSHSMQQSSHHATVHRSTDNNPPTIPPSIAPVNNPPSLPESQSMPQSSCPKSPIVVASRGVGGRHGDSTHAKQCSPRAAILSPSIQATLLPSCHHPAHSRQQSSHRAAVSRSRNPCHSPRARNRPFNDCCGNSRRLMTATMTTSRNPCPVQLQ
jgi:hypothetical protein